MKGVHEQMLSSYLDEFMWRERHGRTSSAALCSMCRDIALRDTRCDSDIKSGCPEMLNFIYLLPHVFTLQLYYVFCIPIDYLLPCRLHLQYYWFKVHAPATPTRAN